MHGVSGDDSGKALADSEVEEWRITDLSAIRIRGTRTMEPSSSEDMVKGEGGDPIYRAVWRRIGP